MVLKIKKRKKGVEGFTILLYRNQSYIKWAKKSNKLRRDSQNGTHPAEMDIKRHVDKEFLKRNLLRLILRDNAPSQYTSIFRT
jgi:hypothetical protein